MNRDNIEKWRYSLKKLALDPKEADELCDLALSALQPHPIPVFHGGYCRVGGAMKLTPWFPPEIKPVHVGVYEIRDDMLKQTFFAYWNGLFFGSGMRKRQDAANSRWSHQLNEFVHAWRGLAEKP